MKQLVFILLSLLFAFSAQAQRNEFYFGDKDRGDVELALQTLDVEIANIEYKIKTLKAENEELHKKFSRSTNSQALYLFKTLSQKNDSLITAHYKDKSLYEEMKQQVLLKSLNKDNVAYVSSKGNNPEKLLAAAQAYTVMRYADAQVNAATVNSSGIISSLKGAVFNYWYKDVTVKVQGPNNWKRMYMLKANGGAQFFEVPYPGRYIFVFSHGNEVSVCTTVCNPGQSLSYDLDGNSYDLMAVLPRGY